MVYRGRPSTGCKACRERKVKCDERVDGCLKCINRGLKCPGYDRTLDVWFHDETANVQRKVRNRKDRSVAASRLQPAQFLNACLPESSHSSSLRCLSVPYEDQAFKYFMDSSAKGMEQPPFSSQAYHQHLSTHGVHPLVATTMTALGMAGLANLHMDPALQWQATQWYLKSIKMVNAAIANPAQARNDVTLVSIHLSSMFEATFNNKTLSGWSNHVDGAAALVKMRGKEQFSTLAGQRMYIQTIGLLTQNCDGQGIAVPDYVQELNREAVAYLDLRDPRHAYFFLHIETSNFRAHVLRQRNIKLHETILRALELDAAAVAIFEGASAAWQYRTVPCSSKEPGIFGDSYHVYPTHATAQTWNWVRFNRIYYHDIIRNCILTGFATSPPALVDPKYNEILGRSTQLLLQLQSDILASMPQFLNNTPKICPSEVFGERDEPAGRSIGNPAASANAVWPTGLTSMPPTARTSPHLEVPTSAQVYVPKPSKTIVVNFEAENVELPDISKKVRHVAAVEDRLPIIRISGGYSTIWPLYIAGAMPTASAASQDFVLQCLMRISKELGINQASLLAYALRLKRQMANNGEVPFTICPQYLADFAVE